MNETELMHGLAARLAGAAVQSSLGEIAERLLDELRTDHARPKSTFCPIPLSLYGGGLRTRSLSTGCSRCAAVSPARLHPTHQRTAALNQPGCSIWAGNAWIMLLAPGDAAAIPVELAPNAGSGPRLGGRSFHTSASGTGEIVGDRYADDRFESRLMPRRRLIVPRSAPW